MSVNAVHLEYAPRRSRRRRIFIRAARVIILVGVVVGGFRFGPEFLRKAGFLYRQRQCLADSSPADRIAYAEDPAIVPGLVANTLEYAPIIAGGGITAAGRMPRCWTALGKPASSPGAVLFLHERRSPSGERRLVVVSSQFDSSRAPAFFIVGFDLQVTVFQPATWTTPMKNIPQMWHLSVLHSAPPIPPKLKVFAGQADPADATHFTMRYEMYGQEGLVDGWLRDGGRVEIKTRSAPLPFPRIIPGGPVINR